MIDPATVCLFIPPGLKKFKLDLFEGIGRKIIAAGGTTIRHDYDAVAKLSDEVIPIVGVSPQFRQLYDDWKKRGRNFIYWDRGYLRRVFATWLPNGNAMGVPGGYYRWHLNCFQMNQIRDVPSDRWDFIRRAHPPRDPGISLRKWKTSGRHIVIADTLPDYWDVFADRQWVQRTVEYLKTVTDRKIVVRDKESKLPLDVELRDAHCLVSHGSIAAVEAVIMGCPVFVHPFSAASLVGETDFSKIETPVYPDREKWVHSLAYNQWNEKELVDGTLWRLIA